MILVGPPRFSGKQYKGAMRELRREKAIEAYQRALRIWNDGTGMIHVSHDNPLYMKRVGHPFAMLPMAMRGKPHNEDKKLDWPLLGEIMPTAQQVRDAWPRTPVWPRS